MNSAIQRSILESKTIHRKREASPFSREHRDEVIPGLHLTSEESRRISISQRYFRDYFRFNRHTRRSIISHRFVRDKDGCRLRPVVSHRGSMIHVGSISEIYCINRTSNGRDIKPQDSDSADKNNGPMFLPPFAGLSFGFDAWTARRLRVRNLGRA